MLVALTLAGLALRLLLLGDPLYGDEIGTWYSVDGHGLGRTVEIVAGEQEVTPPLFFMLAWAAGKLGDPTVTLRLVPLLAGVATIPLTYVLGARTVGRPAGLVGAALVAFSPFMTFFATEARAYALITLVALLSTLALLRALDTNRRAWWAAYAALSLAGMYTHYTVAFVLGVQLVWALAARPRARRPLLAANVVAAVSFLPWFSEFREDGRSGCSHIIDAAHPFGGETFIKDLGHLVAGHPILGLGTLPGQLLAALLGAGLALALVGLGLRLRDSTRPRPDGRLVLVAALAATPLLIALYSAIGDNSIYAPRNLMTAFPAIAVLVGALLRAPLLPAVRIAATALVVGAMAAAGIQMLDPDNRRPDYTALAGYLAQAAQPGDPVINSDHPTSPGPYSAVDTALILAGAPASALPVINLGAPPVAELVKGHAMDGAEPCRSQFRPRTPLAEVAREAAERARNGRIFVVTRALPGRLAELRAALPGYRVASQRSFRGLTPGQLRVTVLARG